MLRQDAKRRIFANMAKLILAALILCSVPVFFVSYFFMLKLMFQALPNWAFIIAGLSHIIVIVTLAHLHDFQQRRK